MRRRATVRGGHRSSVSPHQSWLVQVTDHGHPVRIPWNIFAPKQREIGWGPYLEPFIRHNAIALSSLDLTYEILPGKDGREISVRPAGKAGAIPLRAAQTGKIQGGVLVVPRFGWAGVGSILQRTGWRAAPDLLALPRVPGSGREVPSWVIAGPVLIRLERMLRNLVPGYQQLEEDRQQPRGRILWTDYCSHSLARGSWSRLPRRYPDLSDDPEILRYARWTLDKIRRDLLLIGAADPVARVLLEVAARLVDSLRDVTPERPPSDIVSAPVYHRLAGEVLHEGLEAMGWIADERGLGGGRELDGLAWALSLDQVWERFVEHVVRSWAATSGGNVLTADRRETVFPLRWSDPVHRSLGHLAPDFVVQFGRRIFVLDAKYKSHLSDLDARGWHEFVGGEREAHRADLHQILAYSALYDADEVTAVLIYPLRQSTWRRLQTHQRTVSLASLTSGHRQLTVALVGIPFGGRDDETRLELTHAFA